MEALEAVSLAAEIVTTIVDAVLALKKASRDLKEAPKKLGRLEDLIIQLRILVFGISQETMYKIQNSALDRQIQTLHTLIEQLTSDVSKAKKLIARTKSNKLIRIAKNAVAGDPIARVSSSVMDDLNWWLNGHKLMKNIENEMFTTAKKTPFLLKVDADEGYPISSKCKYLSSLLDQENSNRVILIVGLSGVGKSCLARQVASNPPPRFVDGAVELRFGQWFKKSASDENNAEYTRRLTMKLCMFLVQIGYWNTNNSDKISLVDNKKYEKSGDLEYICSLLQQALRSKSILILLDDVWEQNIVELFTNLKNNNCRYLVTTRNESVCEVSGAQKVDFGKDDTVEISKSILLHHSGFAEDELPAVAWTLLERCGHHPLTIAVIGKSLRKEKMDAKWERAIADLSTYAKCAPGPTSYANEKEVETEVTIFQSFEFSLDVMSEDSRSLFLALGALSWEEPVPEPCLEAIWSVLGSDIIFPLIVCKLEEGSLLMKPESCPWYEVHDMVSLYLDNKTDNALKTLLSDVDSERNAYITPWLFVFGKETIKRDSGQRMESHLRSSKEAHVVAVLKSVRRSLMASITISSNYETSRAGFSAILGPLIGYLISKTSGRIVAGCAKTITDIFSDVDYPMYLPLLKTVDTIDKLTSILEERSSPVALEGRSSPVGVSRNKFGKELVGNRREKFGKELKARTSILAVLAKLAELGDPDTVETVLEKIPMNQLADLINPKVEWQWHESVFTSLMSLIRTGKRRAVEKMFESKIEKNLLELLQGGSEFAQHQAIETLKAMYEFGGTIQPDTLDLLPSHFKVKWEQSVTTDKSDSHTLELQINYLIQNLLDNNNKKVIKAMQDLKPIIEKAAEPAIRDMILQSQLIKRLSELLQYEHPLNSSMRSESASILMKLASSGGDLCIKRYLQHDVVSALVKMMLCNVAELQDSAYAALHELLFAKGGNLIAEQFLQMHLIEKLIHAMMNKSVKTKEISIQCILDIVEVGNKICIERMVSLQLVEKIVSIEKTQKTATASYLVGFLKRIDNCNHLLPPERKVMKLQILKKVRTALKGHKFEDRILAIVEGCARGIQSG